MKWLFLLLSLFFVISCKEENHTLIPDEVKNEYNAFLSEARARNTKLNHKKLKAIILQGRILPNQMHSGNCHSAAGIYDHKERIIIIDTTSFQYTHLKECLLFHELGHALMGLPHDNLFFSDGTTPVSIMNGAASPYWGSNFYYQRSYYVDQLFFLTTPSPDWAK